MFPAPPWIMRRGVVGKGVGDIVVGVREVIDGMGWKGGGEGWGSG